MDRFRLNWTRDLLQIRFMTLLSRKGLLCGLSFMNIFFFFSKGLGFNVTWPKNWIYKHKILTQFSCWHSYFLNAILLY